jgi:PAS domain S-box-containing protein
MRDRLAVIIESTQDAIYSEDLDGVVVSWNPGAERLFGYTAREAIGEPVTFMFPPDRLEEEVRSSNGSAGASALKRMTPCAGTRRAPQSRSP